MRRSKSHVLEEFRDPIKLAKLLWPHVSFYNKQKEILYSVVECDETFVTAGHMLGKDFIAGYIALWFFLTRSPCRIVTTSADYAQLESVLWGEIRRFIQTSKYPLEFSSGGPLVVNHLHIRKVVRQVHNMGINTRLTKNADAKQPVVDALSYLVGRVAAKGEGLQGHHIADIGDGVPRTLFIADEASGVDDLSYRASSTWANRKLVIGNPYPCPGSFFEKGVEGGILMEKDSLAGDGTGDDDAPNFPSKLGG